ncbi:MAG: MFS transporter [Gammaproteobacteria bacterium]|nr:MAG: MFS transporter [Gammaproteobacteria bacterium]
MPLAQTLSWGEAVRVYLHPRVLGMLFLGFSAGLPFLLVFSTLSFWLADENISRSMIGLFSWIGITYSIKVFWAPVVDRVHLPILTRLLGRRRSWMLLAQCGIAFGLFGMSLSDPSSDLTPIIWFGLLVAFSSATQDISIDAYRIEAIDARKQAVMAATYIGGYRIALLVAGAGALYLAEYLSWSTAYLVMAMLMAVGFVTTLIISEPENGESPEGAMLEQRVMDFLERSHHWPQRARDAMAWFIGAVVCPFVDFFKRNGTLALVILLFIGVFRLSDITMGVMANPFYHDLGFTKTEVANVAKIFGFFMTIGGAALGGLLVVRYGIMRPLLLGAVMVASTNLLFALMAVIGGTSAPLLAMVITADNLSGGLSNAAFIAYLSSLTNRSYTATQYALFSSLMTLPGKFIGGFSGFIVDGYGYVSFFLYAAAVGVPAILLVLYLMKRDDLLSTETSAQKT